MNEYFPREKQQGRCRPSQPNHMREDSTERDAPLTEKSTARDSPALEQPDAVPLGGGCTGARAGTRGLAALPPPDRPPGTATRWLLALLPPPPVHCAGVRRIVPLRFAPLLHHGEGRDLGKCEWSCSCAVGCQSEATAAT